jgi:integrase
MPSTITSDMTFHAAAEVWLLVMEFRPQSGQNGQEWRLPQGMRRGLGYVSARTLADFRAYIRTLNRYFSQKRVGEITATDLRTYQQMRADGHLSGDQRYTRGRKAGAGAGKINQELDVLRRILQRAGSWTVALQDEYMPLQKREADVQRAMTLEEQTRFLSLAARNPRWALVYWYAVLALRTTLSTNEERGLRLQDINLEQSIIMIRSESAKNRSRIRTIPLQDDAFEAVKFLLARAESLGSILPQHYLFPFGVGLRRYDPTRSMTVSGIKRQWTEVRKAAGLPWLRPYDLRHTAITRLAEAGTPLSVIMDLAGHVTEKMRQHYTHISDGVKRLAMKQASAGKKPVSVVLAPPGAPLVGNGSNGLSVPSLIRNLQAAGMASDAILKIIEGSTS